MLASTSVCTVLLACAFTSVRAIVFVCAWLFWYTRAVVLMRVRIFWCACAIVLVCALTSAHAFFLVWAHILARAIVLCACRLGVSAQFNTRILFRVPTHFSARGLFSVRAIPACTFYLVCTLTSRCYDFFISRSLHAVRSFSRLFQNSVSFLFVSKRTVFFAFVSKRAVFFAFVSKRRVIEVCTLVSNRL